MSPRVAAQKAPPDSSELFRRFSITSAADIEADLSRLFAFTGEEVNFDFLVSEIFGEEFSFSSKLERKEIET